MKFEIKNRFSGEVQFIAEIEADEKTSLYLKIGLAVRWAYKTKANLRGADLQGADLQGADLQGADLQGANLQGANLRDTYLRGANLRGAYLRGADLQGADLQGANLQGANLRDTYLRGANLQGAYLRGAYLQDAYLRGADLQGANLQGANLRGANLQDTYLRGADLQGAYLQGAYLRGADGEKITIEKVPIQILTDTYYIIIFDAHMKIGCEFHSIADWWAFDNERIAQMDGTRARRFWDIWKEPLQAVCKANRWHKYGQS